jgi:two-component system, OmpR family, phosphate regulon sensor histidine kinase PhoR
LCRPPTRRRESCSALRIRGAQIRAHLRQPDIAAMLERVLGGQAEGGATFVTSSASRETVWQVIARAMPPGLITLS